MTKNVHVEVETARRKKMGQQSRAANMLWVKILILEDEKQHAFRSYAIEIKTVLVQKVFYLAGLLAFDQDSMIIKAVCLKLPVHSLHFC